MEQPTPNPVGRPSKYKPEYCEAVIKHMSEGASLTSFAASIDVSRATINVWMEEHKEFLEAAMTAKSKCAAWWESVGRKNAVEGGGNATLVVFGLKNMAADDWRDKRELDHQSSDGTMTPQVVERIIISDKA